ncbi:NB-ARC domain-containing protein [Streptomyces roseoviridis]|uniref:NB-ARC domain-containing protein n=1 Tax=Streptomyces roseoviridis TaxID=67361 RepID=A0ABV5QQX3_9ACTN
MRGAVRGASLAGTAAAVAVLASLAANAATSQDRWPGALDRIRQQPWWWVAGLAAVGVLVAVVLAWRQERGALVAGDPPPPPPQAVPDWVVDRGERARTVKAVCRAGRPRRRPAVAAPSSPGGTRRFRLRRTRRAGGSRTVAITTSLEGAGGFGKTVLARAVAASPRVRRHFRGRIYTVTIGRDVRGRAAIAAKVAEATRFLTGDTTAFDDPGLAGDHLGRLLDRRPRTLLLLDDVWDAEQLEPFLRGGERCVRLVTTRVPAALPRGTERVRVDQMSPDQARAVLTWELPRLPETLVRDLLEATGRWALLLRLTNRLVTRRIATGTDPADAAAEALRGLLANGPAAVDADPAALDLDDPVRRARAVRATVEAARTLLPPGGDRRLAELAVFAEDESIPVPLVARLWEATGGLTEDATRSLCGELDRLSLVSLTPDHGGRITMHDVLRDYLHKELGGADAAALHGTVADAAGADPWEPPEDSRGYLLDHTIEHLLAAGRTAEAERVASDLRWIETRLHQRGPMAAWADLFDVPTPMAARLADDLTRTAHLLTPTDPPELLTNVLHSRLEPLPLWRDRVLHRQTVPEIASRPLLRNRSTPPDLPEPALLRTFLGHTGPVRSVAVVPDPERGRPFLVTIGADGMARGLDPDSGGEFTVDVRGPGRFRALAVAPDGTWLATGGSGRNVHLWTPDRATPSTRTLGPVGERGASLRGLSISPSGTRVATLATDSTLEVWDVGTGECLFGALPRGAERVGSRPWRADEFTCVAFSPGGSWLAAGGDRGVELMSPDLATRLETRGDGAHGAVDALAVAPDGSWLVAAERGGDVRVWDEVTLKSVWSAKAHDGGVTAVAVSPDGRWAGSGGRKGTVAVWDGRTGECRIHCAGHRGPVHAVAFTTDGDRLISAGEDGTVRVWDATGSARSPRSDAGEGMRTVTVVDGGTRLAVWHTDGRTRLHDVPGAADGQGTPLRADVVQEVAPAFAPDGDWYAAATAAAFSVELRDRDSGAVTATLELGRSARAPVRAQALAVAPAADWLAVADSTGAVQLWDRATSTQTASLPGGEGRADSVTVAPDGSWVAVLRQRPVPRREEARRVLRSWLAVLRHGRLPTREARSLIRVWLDALRREEWPARGEDSQVQVFPLAPGRGATDPHGPVHLDVHHGEKVTALSATPDGRLLTASATGTVTLWDPRTGTPLSAFTDPDGPVNGLSVSPDGRRIATAGVMLRVWDAATGRTVAGVRAETPLGSCAWLPDGRGLVAVGERGLYAHEFVPGSRT